MILFPDYEPLINKLSEVNDILDKARDTDWRVSDLYVLDELVNQAEFLCSKAYKIKATITQDRALDNCWFVQSLKEKEIS